MWGLFISPLAARDPGARCRSRERLLDPNITARPRLLSVTESIALPPRPKGGQYVKYLQIQYSRVARAPGIAADLFCAVGRRCDAHSVVVTSADPRRQLSK